MRVQVSPKADSQILDQIAYIAARDPTAAERRYERISEVIDKLGDFPHWGRIGSIPGTRELAIPGTSYVMIYQIREETVEILRLYHGKQDWQREMAEWARQREAEIEDDTSET